MAGTNRLGLFSGNLHRLDSRFLVSWVLATFIGVIAGWKVFDQINITSVEGSAGSFILLSKWFICLGIAASLTQWIALQQAVKVKWWLTVSTVGYIVGGTIGAFFRAGLTGLTFPIVTNLIAGATVGSIASAIQWLTLRYSASGAGSWIFANATGWSLGWACFRADFLRFLYPTPGLQVAIPIMLLAFPLGIITGVTLIRLLSNSYDAKQSIAGP